MDTIRVDRKIARIDLSTDELVIINNALNEICHGIYIEEFLTRIGYDRENVILLLDKIGELIDKMNR